MPPLPPRGAYPVHPTTPLGNAVRSLEDAIAMCGSVRPDDPRRAARLDLVRESATALARHLADTGVDPQTMRRAVQQVASGAVARARRSLPADVPAARPETGDDVLAAVDAALTAI